MAKIKYTRKGQPYKIMPDGRARFIKATAGKKIRISIKRVGATMARRKRRSYGKVRIAKRSNSILGMSGNTIWQGVGAGTAGFMGGVLNQFVPQIPNNLSQGVAGLGLSYFGKGIIKQVGKGMVIKTIGDLVEDNLVPMIAGRVNNNDNSQANWLQ